ncbi:MAG: AAA family ATPase [Candidatus Poribacteria bacterium]|nr:AAA family ATPase [Candidatus Poribacteria bacterium]
MSITQFTLEEVRCFGERQTLEIRPLTFLVGENSTGKTTALACFHVLVNYLRGRGVDFNEKPSNPHPYSLGTFKDIVRNSNNKEKAFKLGFTSKYANDDIEWTVEFIERQEAVEPSISLVSIVFPNGEVVFKIKDSLEKPFGMESFDSNRHQYHLVCNSNIISQFPLSHILDNLDHLPINLFKEDLQSAMALVKYLKSLTNPIEVMAEPWDLWYNLSILSTSPIRSRPERTYDPMREFNDPEGSDIPLLLMRLDAAQKNEWEGIKKHLVKFGKSSGLFQNIRIKKLGHSLGDPFQLQFKVRGPSSNIMDVGYGVSQILPVLVQVLYPSISRNNKRTYSMPSYALLQQPEVHLHPKAQAEFSSLLAKLANQGNQSFIVETHSDYMIDRARIEIRNGNIKPEDVSLIYFEPKGNIVKVHNIGFDEMANLTNVPNHYRQFFLNESKRLMGFEG